MLWQDLQETFYLVFAPCIAGVVVPFFIAGGILIAVYRFGADLVPSWRHFRRK